jgi:hypothetical protein
MTMIMDDRGKREALIVLLRLKHGQSFMVYDAGSSNPAIGTNED